MKDFTPEVKLYYDIFKLPKTYLIDKSILKKKYYEMSKKYHPDVNNESEISPNLINKAYLQLKDDFYRAKLFTPNEAQLPYKFLEKCLDFESRIKSGEQLKDKILKKIEKCKKNYLDPIWVSKWSYYRRLLNLINGSDAY